MRRGSHCGELCYSLLFTVTFDHFSVSEVNRVINENLYAHICILYMCRKCNHTLSWIYIKLLSHGTNLVFFIVMSVCVCVMCDHVYMRLIMPDHNFIIIV